jgi:hypothetical protein
MPAACTSYQVIKHAPPAPAPPGKYHDLPVKPWDGRRVLACEWKEWATAPPGEHTLEAMHLMYEQVRGGRDGGRSIEVHWLGSLPVQRGQSQAQGSSEGEAIQG